MKLNKLYNGMNCTKKNVLEMMIKLADAHSSEYEDMTEDEVEIIRKVANQNYEGCEEDLEYLVEKLNGHRYILGILCFDYEEANCQNIYDILSEGFWYYQEKCDLAEDRVADKCSSFE